ncbi:hypothetical protein SDC9_127002 [bioreactor metagenome]|uniref:Uncharacterized protein n=1 Tax=bioreactor metagenome TaxID=1076179 RepID=A0A645CST4_9ZZZZ
MQGERGVMPGTGPGDFRRQEPVGVHRLDEQSAHDFQMLPLQFGIAAKPGVGDDLSMIG